MKKKQEVSIRAIIDCKITKMVHRRIIAVAYVAKMIKLMDLLQEVLSMKHSRWREEFVDSSKTTG